ncbi:MAG: energy-coupling factor transporter ATPase, partial [Clostridia bacterium]|nr:energy-coupling factor transporter ATPase [Clostridia bacterium]
VDLNVNEGEITGLIGPTGSGKSTLVQLINGILKPTDGDVILDGVNIWEQPKKIREVRFKAGVVMQYPEYQLFADTVREDIAFGPKNMGLNEEEITERVNKAAAFAGLDPSVMSRSPFDLSGGQKRRAALAGVIAMEPKVLILDEPAAGLDPGGRAEVLGGLKKYQRTVGSSIIIVSHSMEDMANYCDRIVVMTDGKIAMTGTPSEIFARYNDLIGLGLDVPRITRVAAALSRRGINLGEVYTVGYAVEKLTQLL